MKNILKYFLFSLVFVLMVGVSVYQLNGRGYFNVQDVQIVIKTKASQKSYAQSFISDLENQLEVVKNQSMLSMPMGFLSKKMNQQKWIKNYHIQREWPSTLKVIIEPQSIVYVYVEPKKIAEGKVYPVSDDGEMLPELKTEFAPPVPTLKGEVFKKDSQKIKNAIALSKALPENGRLNQDNLSEVIYDPQSGYVITTTDNSLKIKMGEDDFSMKSLRVSEVMNYLDKKSLKARVIDANLSKKVLVRLQQNP